MTGYVAVDGPGVCNLYEIPDVEVFGEAYQALAPADPFRPLLAPHSTNGVRGVYEMVTWAGEPPTWSSPELSVTPVGLGDGRAAHRWFESEQLFAREAQPALVSAVLGHAVAAPVATDDAPAWLAFGEWDPTSPAPPGCRYVRRQGYTR